MRTLPPIDLVGCTTTTSLLCRRRVAGCTSSPGENGRSSLGAETHAPGRSHRSRRGRRPAPRGVPRSEVREIPTAASCGERSEAGDRLRCRVHDSSLACREPIQADAVLSDLMTVEIKLPS